MKNTDKPSRDTSTFLQPCEPWPDPVYGAGLLSEIRDTIRAHVVLRDHAAEAIALWIMFAHAHDAATFSPILAIQSPEKRCGKTTLLNLIGRVVPLPLPSSNATAPVIFRAVDEFRPTLLLDEADTFVRHNEGLRGILNSGFTKDSAFSWRCVGDAHEPKPFSTWSPKAIALIGKLSDTLQDRAIIVTLRRRLPTEHTEKVGKDARARCERLHRQAARWAADNLEALYDAPDPEMPYGLGDRAEDAWSLMLAIADTAGGDWPELARTAALALSGAAGSEAETPSDGVLLLAHVREIFDDKDARLIGSTDLAHALNDCEEWPWGEWRNGKELTTRGIAALLKPFGITPKRAQGGSLYLRHDFEDAWLRYLPSSPSQVRSSAIEQGNVRDFNELRPARPMRQVP